MPYAILCLLALTGVQDAKFADVAAGREFLASDRDYFDQLQPLEMAAKTSLKLPEGTLAQRRDACRERYRAAVRAFTPDEEKALSSATSAIDAALAADFPLFVSTPWRFLKLASHIEGGMPHTRGPYIVLSTDVCRGIAGIAALNGAAGRPPSWVVELLVHEKMHVLQRQHPEIFDDLYINHWGLIKARRIVTCPWLVEHHLVNPDGPDCPWIFPLKQEGKTTYIWPLVTLSDGSGPKQMPADFRLLAIHVAPQGDGFKVETDRAGKPVADNLEDVAAYREAFAGDNNYHPNETLADHFAKMVVGDHFSTAARGRDGMNFAMLRGWCREHLRPPSKRI